MVWHIILTMPATDAASPLWSSSSLPRSFSLISYLALSIIASNSVDTGMIQKRRRNGYNLEYKYFPGLWYYSGSAGLVELLHREKQHNMALRQTPLNGLKYFISHSLTSSKSTHAGECLTSFQLWNLHWLLICEHVHTQHLDLPNDIFWMALCRSLNQKLWASPTRPKTPGV